MMMDHPSRHATAVTAGDDGDHRRHSEKHTTEQQVAASGPRRRRLRQQAHLFATSFWNGVFF
jgi:hypothetical protein